MNQQSLSSSDAESAARIARTVEEHGIERVLVGGCDVNGNMRAKFVPAWRFRDDPAEPAHFSDVFTIMDIEDAMIPGSGGPKSWWPTWADGFGDIEGVPDLSTFRVAPWLDRGAVMLCDFHDLSGNRMNAMPRNVLRRVVERAESRGLLPTFAPELEFMLFHKLADGVAPSASTLVPRSTRSATYGGGRIAADLPIIGAMQEALEAFGVPIEAVMAEAGPGQYELNLTPQPALRAADEAFLFKLLVKHVAQCHGYTATFMPKLAAGSFGSSLHVHQSLWTPGGENVFHDPDAADGLSTIARQYIAGMVRTMREFTAVFAPFITSYKRFEPEAAVGTAVTWSIQSKAVGVRAVPGTPKATRIEHRTPGADANAYLVLAAMLAGGLWGIESELDPGQAYMGNAYADPDVETVPSTLAEAVDMFEQSKVANEFLGEDAVGYFAETRRWEIAQFNAAVTDWEFNRYFESV